MDTALINSFKQNCVHTIVAGGAKNFGFLSKDLDNYRRDQCKPIESHDADLLLCYFKAKACKIIVLEAW